jgi:hypothetical protein
MVPPEHERELDFASEMCGFDTERGRVERTTAANAVSPAPVSVQSVEQLCESKTGVNATVALAFSPSLSPPTTSRTTFRQQP